MAASMGGAERVAEHLVVVLRREPEVARAEQTLEERAGARIGCEQSSRERCARVGR